MLLSIFLISTAVLAYEIVLMRIFSITQWYHFAYMIISIALLGFGASGTVISVFRARLTRRFLFYYRLFSCLFPVSIILSYFLSQRNQFNPFEIVWNPRQYLYLMEYYLVLFVPFFFAAMCIGLIFTQYTNRIGFLYCANLIGSGFGALGVIVGLYFFHPVLVQYIIIGTAFCGTMSAFSDFKWSTKLALLKRSSAFVLILLIILLVFSLKYDPLGFRKRLAISQYKGLSLAQNFLDAQLLTESISPLGVVHSLSSPIIRNAPGLSLNYTGDIPSQIGLFIDSGNSGVITNAAEREKHPLSSLREETVPPSLKEEHPPTPLKGGLHLEFLDFLSSALVYHVRPTPKVLILGAGGGTDVLNALYHEATSVDAVELNPGIIYLVQDRFRDFASHLYSRPDVQVINQEARGVVESTYSTYDTIQISLLDSFGASSAGVHALHENYLYTVEAIKRYYSRLRPQGILSVTRWVKFPPRDNIKLFATAVEALEELGVTEISQHLVSIRSWATSTLLLSRSPLTPQEIERIRTFCHERSFDTNYFPGITVAHANVYNQLPSAEYYRAAQALLFGEKETFYISYPYYVRPARDNSPYFFHFFKWKSLTTLLKTMGRDWIPFIEWGYLVLLATLLQASVVSIILIIIPLSLLPRRSISLRYKLYTVIYFTCLGLGYLFIEMVCIQKFTLFLANPVAAVSVVIASFLIFSGFGSLYFELRVASCELRVSNHNLQFTTYNSQLAFAVSGIIGLSLIYALFLSSVFSACAGWSYFLKVLLSVICIAPLGFCMGIPFPFGLKRLNQQTKELVPWAYGINGYASVLSSLIATCVAISSGFQTVMLCAGILYVLAAGITLLTFPRQIGKNFA
jgi:spermidine synthase